MVVFPIHKLTIIAFTTTSNISMHPKTIRTKPISSSLLLWSIPSSHPHHNPSNPDVSSRLYDDDDDVSIKNLSATNRRSFIQRGSTSLSSILLLLVNIISTQTASSFVTNTDVVHAIEMDTTVLRPATEEQPQIPFPDINALKEVEAVTTLEGTSREKM